MAFPTLALSSVSAAGRPRYAMAITPLQASSSCAPRSVVGAVAAAAASTASASATGIGGGSRFLTVSVECGE